MGARDSKPSFVSYDDAVKKVSDSELRRIREAFKRCAGANGTTLSLEAFVHEVLCDAVPFEVAEWLYQACGGTKRGIAFKDLLCGIVILTKGNIEEKIKFLWTLYVNNRNDNNYIYKWDFAKILHIENNSLPVTEAYKTVEILTGLFGPNERVTFDQFRSWILIHKKATVLSRWLLSDYRQLIQDLDTPTFYQSLAGVTHLEEKEIIELEKCFWALRNSSPSGQLDLESLSSVISPPFPPEAVEGVFLAFDENRDGHIDFKELCCGVSAAVRGPVTERLKFSFKIFDKDGDGVLKKQDLIFMAEILSNISTEFMRVQEARSSTPSDDGHDCTYKCDPEIILQDLWDKILVSQKNGQKPMFQLGPKSDVEDIIQINEKQERELSEKSSPPMIPEDAQLSLEELVMWSVGGGEWCRRLLRVLSQLCHVAFCLQPSPPSAEPEPVLDWIARETYRGLQVGQLWYLIDAEWWAQWLAYCDVSSTDSLSSLGWRGDCSSVSSGGSSGVSLSPGAPAPRRPPRLLPARLAPSHTLQVPTLTGEGGMLRKDITLAQHRDFELVPAAVWRALSSWYGYSLALPRQVIRPPNSEPELELYPVQLEIWMHAPGSQRLPSVSNVGGVSAYNAAFPAPAPPERKLSYTAAFSRLATIRQVSEFLCQSLGMNREDMRLWLLSSNESILLDDEKATLQRLNITSLSSVLLEHRNADLTWPEEIGALRNRGGHTERRATLAAPDLPGATGLHNLGNTCYMNAALQSVWNFGPLTRYFNSGTYLYEVNTTNPLGTKGALALAYGELCKEVWSGSCRSVAPLRVRLHVTRHARLAANQQHDAQELLAWLLDALHEDTRRQSPSSLPPADPTTLTWEQYISRNNSIITELFYGLLQSRVRCEDCGRDSVRREPFNVLSVPLPVDTTHRRKLTVIPADGSVPVQYGVTVPCEATLQELKQQLSLLCGMHKDTLLIVEISGPLISRVFSDDTKVSSTPHSLHAYELPLEEDLSDDGTDVEDDECTCVLDDTEWKPQDGAGRGEVSAASLCMPALFCFQRSRSEILMSQSPPGFLGPRNSVYGDLRSSTLPRDTTKYHQANGESSPTPSVRSLNLNSSPKLGKVKFCSSPSNMYKMNGLKNVKLGKRQYLIAVHRKQTRSEAYFLPWQRARSSLFGWPLVVRRGGARSLHARLAAALSGLLSAPPPPRANHAHDCDDSLGYEFPFTIRVVGPDGTRCGVCAWHKHCNGCRLVSKPRCSISSESSQSCRLHGPSDSGIFEDTSQNEQSSPREIDIDSLRHLNQRDFMLAIDWDPTALHLRYQSSREKAVIEHPSVQEIAQASSRAIDLQSCLSAFTAEERLEGYHCTHCGVRPAHKAMSLWRLPPSLIIHLKRFQFVNNKWIKSQKVVNFPFEDFDPTEFLATVPKETILRYKDLKEKRDSIVEEVSESDDDSCTSSDALKSNPKEKRRKHVQKRERLISQSLLANPVQDDNLIDYHQHHLSEGQDPFDLKYRLYAVVSHTGQINGGHYVAYVRHSSGAWLCHNDSSCRVAAAASVPPDAAYLLLYERRRLHYDRYLPDVTGKTPVTEVDGLDADENDLRKLCVIA